jgi:hypothetical protein
MSGYCQLKEEALERILWRTRCGRGYWPVRRQAAELMTESVPHSSPPESTFLQSLVFAPSSPCPVPLISGWLMADHPVDVSSQFETVRMNCQKWHFCDMGKGVRYRILRDTGTELFKTHKTETVRGKTWRMSAAIFHGVKGSW